MLTRSQSKKEGSMAPKTISIVFDTETNGLPPRMGWDKYPLPEDYRQYDDARMIEIAYSVYENEVKVKDYQSLVMPIDFSINNEDIHGISTEDAFNQGQYIENVLKDVYDDFKECDVLVAHNINFDIHILLAEAHRQGEECIPLIEKIIQLKKICTMKTGCKVMKTTKWPKLVVLYKHLFDKDFDQKHRAMSDVDACAECYIHMVKNYKIE